MTENRAQTETDTLVAAGWNRLARSAGECGEALITKGRDLGLACKRSAMWVLPSENVPRCKAHAIALVATPQPEQSRKLTYFPGTNEIVFH